MTTLNVSDLLNDPNITSISRQGVLTPTSGQGAAVAASVYSGRKNIINPSAPLFDPDSHGLFRIPRRDTLNMPLTGKAVCLSSVGAEATRAENALWRFNKDNGLNFPAIELLPATDEEVAAALTELDKRAKSAKASKSSGERLESAKQLMGRSLRAATESSWTQPHRHVDAQFRYAEDPTTGDTVWSGNSPLYSLITTSGVDDAKLLALSPNSLVYGYWLSSGAPVLFKRARSVRSEVWGFNATPVDMWATKIDPIPSTSHSSITGDSANIEKVTYSDKVDKKNKPSAYGFGSIPAPEPITHYSCEYILSQFTVSLNDMRRTFENSDLSEGQAHLARRFLTLLALAGQILTAPDTDFRSSTNLTETSSVWHAQTRGTAEPIILDVDEGAILEELKETTRALEDMGLIDGPYMLRRSPGEITLHAHALLEQVLKDN